MVAIKDIFPPALLGTPGDLPKQFLPWRSETSSSPFLWGIVLFLHSRVGRLQGKALPLKETGFILLPSLLSFFLSLFSWVESLTVFYWTPLLRAYDIELKCLL